MSTTTSQSGPEVLRECGTAVDGYLRDFLVRPAQRAPRLTEAMRYSLDAGGKRLRPALVLLACRACGGRDAAALPAAAAIECVHTFSLIHDDLPAMDDDDLRRGRATNHRVFGEALAILAGDGLLALAFEILASQPAEAATVVRQVRELAGATGWDGMIAGQVEDIDGEQAAPEAARVERIHELKTARLIRSACRLGALAAHADEGRFAALSDFGHWLGLAFQIADDLLDVCGTTESLGKRAGKDAARGKQTYPRVFGAERSRAAAADAIARAQRALAALGAAAEPLAELAEFIVRRES